MESRSICRILAHISAALLVVTPAEAQFSINGGPSKNPVMSSKDLDAMNQSIGLDDAQRQMVGAMFDDVQVPMFDAKRRFDDLKARIGPVGRDAKLIASQHDARRALAQSMLQSIDQFFQSISAVARPEQREAVERARLATIRRTVRAFVSGPLSEGAVQSDVEQAVESAKLDPAESAAALTSLDPYRQRLASLFPKLIEAVPQAQESGTGLDFFVGNFMPVDGDAINTAPKKEDAAAEKEVRTLLEQLGSAHRDGLTAIAQALPNEEAIKVQDFMLKKVWPRTAQDADSPQRVFSQLLKKTDESLDVTALEAAESAWRTRWWNLSIRMTSAEDQSGKRGIFGLNLASGDDPATLKARTELQELRSERRAVNRDAWKALASLDPARREFYDRCASEAELGKTQRFQAISLPSTPPIAGEVSAIQRSVMTSSSDSDAASGVEVVAATVSASVMFTGDANGSDSEPMVFTIDAAEFEGGAISLQMNSDGSGMAFGDSYSDGLGNSAMLDGSMQVFDSDVFANAGMALARPASQERLRGHAATMGIVGDHPALVALISDYEAKSSALEIEYSESLKNTVGGTSMVGIGDMPAAPIAQIASGVQLLTKHATLLGELDDALINDMAALGSADAALASAVHDERARERTRGIRYPSAPGGLTSFPPFTAIDLSSCIRESDFGAADRIAALRAWSAWSPSGRAVVESIRQQLQDGCIKSIEFDREQLQAAMNSQNQTSGVATNSVDSADAFAGFQARMAKNLRLTSQAVESALAGRQAIAGALTEPKRALFQKAWLRAAVPNAFADNKNAMPALDAARMLPTITPEVAAQIDALRSEHAARHNDLCERLAGFVIDMSNPNAENSAMQMRPAPGQVRRNDLLDDGRFERAELNARSLRRLRTLLNAEEALEIPALRKK